MSVRRWIGIAACSLLVSVSASAATAPDQPYELWRDGKYDQAIQVGEATNTPEGLSVAARAALSDMMMRIPPCLDCVHRAEDLARKAIAADPKAPLPHVYLAVSLGYEARIVGMMEAQRQGISDTVKKALDTAIADDPKNSFAIATLGGWNIDVVRIAGSFLAGLTYGANMGDGIAKYTQAISLDPNDLVIRYQYALSLASCDADKYHDVIVDQLSRATQIKPGSVYESVSQKRASDLLTLLKSGDRQAFDSQVKRYMGIPG